MDIFLILFIYFNSCCMLWVAAACPQYQVSHTVAGKSVCCKPVFNCPIGHQINYCSTDGGRDECVPCGDGMINNYTTSSLDHQLNVCFKMTESHRDCPIADTFPINMPVYCNTMFCSCDTEQCYYGDPCLYCEKSKTKCGENEELNPKTGVCEKCKALMRSPAGCGPCVFDEALWRASEDMRNDSARSTNMEQTTTKLPTKLTSVNKTFYVTVNLQETINTGYIIVGNNMTEPTKTPVTEEDKFPIIPVIIAILVLVLIGLLIAVILYTRRQVQQGNQNRLVAFYHKLHCKKNVQRSNESDIEGNTDADNVEAGLTGEVTRREVASVKPMQKSSGDCEHGASGEQTVDLLKEPEGACGDTEDTEGTTFRKTSTA